jgi:flagellar hook assembly protein FlgD
LYPNFPNPFNPETTIRFCLAEAGAVSLEIFNVKGQKVRSLFAGCLQWGDHSMLFDGKDLRGSKLSSGMYFLRMKTAGGEQIRKMLLLK